MFAKVHMSIPVSAAGKDFFFFFSSNKFFNITGRFKGDASSLPFSVVCVLWQVKTFPNTVTYCHFCNRSNQATGFSIALYAIQF